MNKLLGLMAIIVCVFIVSPQAQAQAQAQQGDGGFLQLRSMQTRKFINVDLKKLTNAIESVVQIQGFNSGLCSTNVPDTLHYCHAYTNSSNRIDFLMQSNVKDKTSILRVSYTKQFQEPPPQEAIDFYSKFFKSMGDILFVDSQKLDMQEIN